MKLNEGEIGRTYLVRNVTTDAAVTRRLEALGVNEMTPVTVLNKKGSGSVVFKVRGTRLAVGRRISDGITVEEMGFIPGTKGNARTEGVPESEGTKGGSRDGGQYK